MSEKIIRIKSGNEETTMNVTEEEYLKYYRPWWQMKKKEQRNREAMEQNGYTEESYVFVVLEAVCSVKGGNIPVPEPPKGKWANAGIIVADGFSLAWRVFDAQFWGVPQRRKRIYLVADFAGGSAGKVLFESEGVSGYSAEGFRAWQGTAGSAAPCIGAAGGMLSGIEGIMNLAAASGEDLASTSDIVTDALTAFGLTAADSGHFADILAAASSNANTNVSMMGETFKYCAPIAGALGFSAEDTAEAIGLMGNAGIKSTQAGTALRTIMSNLSGEVKICGSSIGEVTIATTNADGSMHWWYSWWWTTSPG